MTHCSNNGSRKQLSCLERYQLLETVSTSLERKWQVGISPNVGIPPNITPQAVPLTQGHHHDGDAETLAGALGQAQEPVLQRVLHDVLLLRPHCEGARGKTQQQGWHVTTSNNSTAGFPPRSHCLLEKRISCKTRLQTPFSQLKIKQYKLFKTAARFLDVSPQPESSGEASGQWLQALPSAVQNVPAASPGQPQATRSLQFLLFVLFRKQQEIALCNC